MARRARMMDTARLWDERGVALPMSLLVLVLLTTLMLALLVLTQSEPMIGNSQLRAGQARALAESGHPVSYRLNGANLERTENGATDVVIGGVQEVRVWCYDGKGALKNTLAEIRELRIQVRARAETPAVAGSPGDQRTVAEGRVRFRNI